MSRRGYFVLVHVCSVQTLLQTLLSGPENFWLGVVLGIIIIIPEMMCITWRYFIWLSIISMDNPFHIVSDKTLFIC